MSVGKKVITVCSKFKDLIPKLQVLKFYQYFLNETNCIDAREGTKNYLM